MKSVEYYQKIAKPAIILVEMFNHFYWIKPILSKYL